MRYFLIYFIFINLFTFLTFGLDKYRAVKKRWRIPERRLFLLAAAGGSLGAETGMLVFRHKTKHARFIFGIPAILLLQVCLLLFLAARF